MPQLTDIQPPFVAEELASLRADLGRSLPPKHLDHNILIATWNTLAFGGLTEQWTEFLV